jgi:phage shock protein E
MLQKLSCVLIIVLLSAGSSGQASQLDEMSGTQEAAGAIYRSLNVDNFAEILATRSDDYIIINVHIPYEGEIEGTDLNIAYNDLEALAAAIPSRDTPVILYCRSGNMSHEASLRLLELGYSQVWDLAGGMNAWRDSGRGLLNN